MKITQEILKRLREAVENNGGAVMLSRKSGVDAANISRYLNGKVSSIGDDNWAKLAPYLRENISVSRSETVANTPQLRECIKDAMMRKGITTPSELTRLIGQPPICTAASGPSAPRRTDPPSWCARWRCGTAAADACPRIHRW